MRGKELLVVSEVAQENLKKNSYSSKFKFGRPTHSKKGALKLVEENGENLKRLSQRLKNNKNVVLTSVKTSPMAFEFAGVKAKNDFEVAKYAVLQEPKNIFNIGNKLKEDSFKFRELAKLALNGDGMLLQNLTVFQDDDELVDIAVTNNSLALKFANKRFKSDREFIYKHAIEKSYVLLNADKKLINDKAFIKSIISENPVALHLLPIYQGDVEIVKTAILARPDAVKYANLDLRASKIIKDFIIQNDLNEAMSYLVYDENGKEEKKSKKVQRKNQQNDEIENV